MHRNGRGNREGSGDLGEGKGEGRGRGGERTGRSVKVRKEYWELHVN